MILLIDLGNTRAKWAWLAAGGIGPQHAAEHGKWQTEDWRRELFAARRPTRIVACSVARESTVSALRKAARLDGGSEIEWVVPSARAAGITNGYRDPAQLGADRWAAVVGACHDRTADVCVVNVGTAMTIDAVTREGRHMGGLIVPGPDLMTGALHMRTSDLAGRSAASAARARTTWATDTRSAIENGCELALAALVEHQFHDLERQTGRLPQLVFAGGAAERVREWVKLPSELVPDLVLRGLAVIATQPTP